MPVRLFLSYARNDDEPFVWRLYAALKDADFEVWFDRVSMPSRQLTFHQEIRDAVNECDRLVLVVGPQAIASDYVTQEWRFAYFEALKCVNPIVRLDGVDAAGKKIDGYNLIPEDLRLIHAEDFRDDAQFGAHLANLIRQLSDPLPPAGKLVAVPEPPPHYLDQPARIAALRDILLADLQKPIVLTGAAARVGLQGMGGIGKSVLASALAHRPEVRRAFPDGVYWVTLGQEPNVAELQRGLARALGGDGLFQSVEAGKEKLRELMGGRASLLVLDDVWERTHAEAFNVLGPRGRLLLTTRDAGLVTALAAKENHYQVQLPTEAEAEALLAKAAGVPVQALPAEARQIVGECGRLPLGLALCGGMVHGGRTWRDVLEALREHDLEYLSDSHPAEEQHRSIWKAMDVSVRALPENERERFAELAVFALDTGAPEAAVETLWGHMAGLNPRHARDLLMNFRQRSLIDFDQTTRRMELHDLLHSFASGMAPKQFGSLQALHQRLLDAYREKCSDGWPSGPNDGYFLQHCVSHLIAAGQTDDAVALLTDLPWIETKCKAGLAFGLQEDYRQTIVALPEAQAELRGEERRKAELARWTQTLIECAEQRRLPRPEEILKSVEPWSHERIAAESKRIIENPTRLDRLKAFAGFVEQELYPLDEFGKRPGFVVQHAFNSAPRGPVHSSAAQRAETIGAPLLLRHWPRNPPYSPIPALLRTLEGHSRYVTNVSMTPDGRRAVSGSGDKTLRVWNLETGICLRTLEGHTGRVCGVSVTPDGHLAVSASEDNTLRVWDLERGACLRTLEGHSHLVNSVSVSPNGRWTLSGGEDKTLRLWDLETGVCLRAMIGHSDWVFSVSMTPDGRRAVSGSRDGTLRVWDLETGSCLRTMKIHWGGVLSVSVTPNGRRAVSGSGDHALQVWDLATGACLRTFGGHTGPVVSVSVTPDGHRAVSGSGDHTLRTWDVETGKCLRTLEGHTGWVYGVGVTPDGHRAVSGSGDESLRVWDLEAGACLHLKERHTDSVNTVVVAPGGRRAVSGSVDHTLRVWDLETGDCVRTLKGHTHSVIGVSVTPDGHRAVSGSGDDTLRVWDLATGDCLRTLEGHTLSVCSVSVTPDGRRAVSGSHDNSLRVWDLETGASLRTLEGHTGWVDSVSVTLDGRRAVSGSHDNSLRVWDLETGACLRILEGHTGWVDSVSVTLDGRQAVSGSRDQTLRVWDLETGACLHTMEGHTHVVTVSLAPDRRRAVSGSWDETLRVWDLATGKCLRTLEGHNLVVSVNVMPDGWRVVSGGLDMAVRVSNLETGECQVVARISAPVQSMDISGPLNRVVVGTLTGEIAIYEIYGMAFG